MNELRNINIKILSQIKYARDANPRSTKNSVKQRIISLEVEKSKGLYFFAFFCMSVPKLLSNIFSVIFAYVWTMKSQIRLS
jgi:hypothetical protein